MTTQKRSRKIIRKQNSSREKAELNAVNPTITTLGEKLESPQYLWKPIEDISKDIRKYRSDLRSLHFLWKEQAETLRDTDGLKEFNDRLVRSWSIETGIIEKLYDLDRGITETLITHGFEASLIPHNSGTENPTIVVEMLKDQKNALDLIFDYIKDNRPLTCSFIKDLHSLFTKNQGTTDAVDQFRNIIKVDLLKGQWKVHANNPLRQDGKVHEYAPPVHVASEMDSLMAIHQQHIDENISPEVQSAWLHHAFTQIHPFQDGNGRIARAIASFVFIKNGYFPLVVTRDDRTVYISALEKADGGDLIPLVELFVKLQRRAFKQALGVSQNVITDRQSQADILENAFSKLQNRDTTKNRTQIDDTKRFSADLEEIAFDFLSSKSLTIKQRLKSISRDYDSYAFRGDNENSKSFYGHIIDTARDADYFADTRVYGKWVCLKIIELREFSIVITFHGIGRQSSGTFGAMPFIFTTIAGRDQPAIKLSEEPFIYSYAHPKQKTQQNFNAWLSTVFSTAIAEWGNQIA